MLQVNFDVHHLQLGTKIPDTAAIVPPDTVNYTHYDNDAWYALLMVGLDFPATKDKPYKAPYQHWAVGSIHEDQFLSGECLINYEWTAAPYKKGKHRVVFLIYREPDKEELWKNWGNNIEAPRTYFNTTKFSTKYRLGDPVAVNFFIADIKEDHKSRPIEASPHDC
ncbi:unnamed protein product [Bemisia tabaci]|uniref:Phosphatidylethanolamine-binding protein n=1 Tax=Bemisia tabaci TaxID=7038 RepID=A0A9P0C987_BEMTA|nr:unnamed protein product [Bemisia tabaci]